MRYIRTKDGVIGCFTSKHEYLLEDENYLKENAIINQAYTIPELCDEFVCGDNYLPHCVFKGDINDSFWKDRLMDKDKTVYIYGAIWVKGEHDEPILKSVAKMKGILPNGEIDWELL